MKDKYLMENNTILNITAEGKALEWTRYTFICFMALVILIGVPGNVVVLSVLVKLRNKASTDFFVLTMCAVDLVSSTVNSTLFIFRYEPSIWKMLASPDLCRLHIFTICITVISTTLLLAATAFDRFRKTNSTSAIDTVSTIKRSKNLCVGILLTSSIYSISYIFIITLDSSSKKCVPLSNYRATATIFSSVLSLIFVFMFVVVIICYSRITIILRRHHRKHFPPNTDSSGISSKRRFWSRGRRIQPIGQEMNVSQMNIDAQKPENSIESNEKNNSVGTKSSFLQNKTSNGNDVSLQTVSQTIHSDEKSTTRIQMEHLKQCDDSSQEEAKLSNRKLTNINASRDANVKRDRKKINTTTLMMFLITLIYVATWLINWSTQIYKAATSVTTLKTDFLTERLYMINCMTNPIFYIFMSTKFKQKAKEMFCQ